MTELQKDTSIDPDKLFYGALVEHKYSNLLMFVRDVQQNRLGERFITTLFGEDVSCSDINPVPIEPVFHESCWLKRNAFEQYIYETHLPQGNVQKIIFTDYRVFLQQPNKPKPEIVTIWDVELRGRSMFVHEFQFMYLLITGKKLIFDLNHLINNQTNEKH